MYAIIRCGCMWCVQEYKLNRIYVNIWKLELGELIYSVGRPFSSSALLIKERYCTWCINTNLSGWFAVLAQQDYHHITHHIYYISLSCGTDLMKALDSLGCSFLNLLVKALGYRIFCQFISISKFFLLYYLGKGLDKLTNRVCRVSINNAFCSHTRKNFRD